MMKIYKHTNIINIITGAMLIAAGILVIFGKYLSGMALALSAISIARAVKIILEKRKGKRVLEK